MSDEETIYLDGNGPRMRDIAEERSRRIVEASRPLYEHLRADQRMVVPPELQIHEEGIYDGMPHTIYHADPVPGWGSLSQSGAKVLLPPSCPAKFDYALKHPRTSSTKTFDLGLAAHHMILGIGPELIDVGFDNFAPTGKGNRTKVEQIVAETRARGAIPLTSPGFQKVMEMAAALRAHPEAAALLDPDHGRPEQAIFWTERVHWSGADGQMHEALIWRRCLIDWLPDVPDHGRLIVPDYKTAETAHQETWAKRSAGPYKHHMQDQWITEGLQRLLGVEVAVIFILQEKVPPYLVSIAELGAHEKEVGRQHNWAALELFAECHRSEHWPSYPTIKTVQIPWVDYD